MAYMNQVKKAAIAAVLKKVMPKGWGYTLAVRDGLSIQFTLKKAPVDVLANYNKVCEKIRSREGDVYTPRVGETQVNHFYLDRQFDGEVLRVMEAAYAALNLNNHNNSDVQSDYFDVGHYVDMRIGTYDKPFVVA